MKVCNQHIEFHHPLRCTLDIRMLTQLMTPDEAPRYERDRSASPRPTRRNDSPRGGARRSPSPNSNGVDSRLVLPIHLFSIFYPSSFIQS
jgi:hypothetical protein